MGARDGGRGNQQKEYVGRFAVEGFEVDSSSLSAQGCDQLLHGIGLAVAYGNPIADTCTHDLLALKHCLQYFVAVGDSVSVGERVDQFGDDLLFGLSLEIDDSRIG